MLQARQACSIHSSSFLSYGAVCALAFRDPLGPTPFYPRARFRTILHSFSEAPFLQRSVPKGVPLDSPKQQKNPKSAKNPASKRTRGRAMQKGSVLKGLSSKSIAGAMF